MNNNIDSKISFQADLCIKHLGRHNTKMKSVAKNFKIATHMYPNDKFCIDNFVLNPSESVKFIKKYNMNIH